MAAVTTIFSTGIIMILSANTCGTGRYEGRGEMKLVHFDNYRLGMLTGGNDDRVVDITDLVGTGDERPQE